MQIKTTNSYHHIPVRWLSSINPQMTSAGEDVEKGEPLCIVGGNADWCNHCGKLCRDNSKNLKMDLPFDPVIPLLGIYPKNPKTLIQKNMCTPMFIEALFTLAKIWNQPKHPPVDEWIRQLWDIYTMEYYSKKRRMFYTLQQYGRTWNYAR